MAKSAKKTAPAPTGAAEVTSAMAAAAPIAPDALLKVMNESAQFVMARLQRDLETQKALLSCKSPAELLKVQTDFYQTAMQDYSKEAARMFEMMSSAATSSIKEANAPHKRGYDDVPL